MDPSQIYLIEPYNAYAPKKKTRHWMEVVDEQNLVDKILAEQVAQQAQSQATATPVGGPAGAGGVPEHRYFLPCIADFTSNYSNELILNIIVSNAPFTVDFISNSQNAGNYLWNFGDGTTSTLSDPVHTYIKTGTFTVSLFITNIFGNLNNTMTKTNYVQFLPPFTQPTTNNGVVL